MGDPSEFVAASRMASMRAVAPEIFPQTAERLDEWRQDPDVLGVVLVGSKARGHQDELSDDDLEVLLTDEAFSAIPPAECHALLIEGEGATRRIIYDAQLASRSGLEAKADSPFDLDHWPYERAPVLFDRDGRTQQAVAAAARMAPDFRRRRLAHGTIDAWVAGHRARKTLKRKFNAAATALVGRGVRGLSRIVFALESRWVPLDHWLERELATLDDDSQVTGLMLTALRESSPDPIIEALEKLEDRLFDEGVPRPADRNALFLELIHSSRADERAAHMLT